MKEGWRVTRIGDVCSLMTGGTPSRANPEYFGGEVRWLVSGDIHQGEIVDCEGRITDAGMKNSNAKLLPVNSVMIALNGQGKTRGTVALLRMQATCNQSLVSIFPNDLSELLPEFLYLNLRGRYEEIRHITGDSGNDRRGLNMDLIRSIQIPIAPLPEQQRIVRILDNVLAGIATAKTNAEKNLRSARALFESHLQSVFTQRGPGWMEKTLGEIAENISTGPFGTMLHKSDYVPDGIPLVNPMNIVDSSIVPSRKMMVSERTRERLRSYVLKAGDVVIGRRGELGRCALVTDREDGWLCGTGSFFVRLSQQFRSRLEGSAVGTTMSSLNHGILNELRIPVPPIAVQRKEMARADQLRCETQRLESFYLQKASAFDELKKSLLYRAFTGQL